MRVSGLQHDWGSLMKPEFRRNGKSSIPEALRLEHVEIRGVLAGIVADPGPIGAAALRVTRLCLPHFEQEENIVFPVFGFLGDLATGEVRAGMADLLPLVSEFQTSHAGRQHQMIAAAVQALQQAARAENCAQALEFANRLQVHERIEDEVIYPAVALVGKYLRLSLDHQTRPRSPATGRAWHPPYAAGRFCRASRRNGGNA
jgi:hypothetical protein